MSPIPRFIIILCLFLLSGCADLVSRVGALLPAQRGDPSSEFHGVTYEYYRSSLRHPAALRQQIVFPAPVAVFRPEVENELDSFLDRDPLFVRHALETGAEFIPVVKEILSDEGMPTELLYLAIIESGLRPAAKSPAGALGIWQFTRRTGEPMVWKRLGEETSARM